MKIVAGCMLAIAGACTPASKNTQDAAPVPIPSAVDVAPVKLADVPPQAPRVRIVAAPQDTDALSLVRTERLKAKAEGRVLVVYAGASWCEPCKRFKAELHAGNLDATLSKLTLLTFDSDRDTERLAAAGYRFEFIPFVALPGADGHPRETQEARGKGSDAWRALVAKLESWMPP